MALPLPARDAAGGAAPLPLCGRAAVRLAQLLLRTCEIADDACFLTPQIAYAALSPHRTQATPP